MMIQDNFRSLDKCVAAVHEHDKILENEVDTLKRKWSTDVSALQEKTRLLEAKIKENEIMHNSALVVKERLRAEAVQRAQDSDTRYCDLEKLLVKATNDAASFQHILAEKDNTITQLQKSVKALESQLGTASQIASKSGSTTQQLDHLRKMFQELEVDYQRVQAQASTYENELQAAFHHKNDLQFQLNETREGLSVARHRIAELVKENVRLRNGGEEGEEGPIHNLERRVEHMQSQEVALRLKIKEQAEELDELRQQVSSVQLLRNDLWSAREHVTQMENHFKLIDSVKEQQITETLREIDILKSQLRLLQAQEKRADRSRFHDEHVTQMENHFKLIDSVKEQQITETLREIDILKSQLRLLQAQEKRADRSRFHDEHTALRDKCRTLQDQYEESVRTISALQSNISDLQHKLGRINQAFEESKLECGRLRENNDDVDKAASAALAAEMTALNQQVIESLNELHQVKIQNQQAHRFTTAVIQKCSALEEDLHVKITVNEELTASNKLVCDKLDSVEQLNMQYQSMAENLEGRLRDASSVAALVPALQEEIRELKSLQIQALDQASRQQAASTTDVAFQAQLRSALEEASTLRSEIRKQKDVLKRVEMERQAHNHNAAEMTQQLAEAAAEVEALRGNVVQKEQIIAELQQHQSNVIDLHTKKTHSEQRETSAIRAELVAALNTIESLSTNTARMNSIHRVKYEELISVQSQLEVVTLRLKEVEQQKSLVEQQFKESQNQTTATLSQLRDSEFEALLRERNDLVAQKSNLLHQLTAQVAQTHAVTEDALQTNFQRNEFKKRLREAETSLSDLRRTAKDAQKVNQALADSEAQRKVLEEELSATKSKLQTLTSTVYSDLQGIKEIQGTVSSVIHNVQQRASIPDAEALASSEPPPKPAPKRRGRSQK
eukprot:PhF_6_TR6978/c0_g1_i1/m.10319